MSTVPRLPPQFGKLVALMQSTTHAAERATARRKAEALLPPSAGGFDRALRILAFHQARAAAPNNMFAGMDEHHEIDHPGHMAQLAAARAKRLEEWHARRAALVERYGSLKAVEAPCERETLLLKALKPWRVPGKRPHQRWTFELKGWDDLCSVRKMPPGLRAAIEGAYPMPTTFAEARAEAAYWRERNDDMEHAMGQNGMFMGNHGLDRVAVARMGVIEDLVEREMRLKTLSEIVERLKIYWADEAGTNEDTEAAIIRDLEAMTAGSELVALSPIVGCGPGRRQ